MKHYSPERKAAILIKLLPPHNLSIERVAQQEGVSPATLYSWRNQVKLEGKPVPGAHKNPDQWSAEGRFAALVETATLSETEISAYCREKGLYPAQLAQWKAAFLGHSPVMSPTEKAELKSTRIEIKKLQRELNRKEKALAEAAALLVLRKKLDTFYGVSDEED